MPGEITLYRALASRGGGSAPAFRDLSGLTLHPSGGLAAGIR
jgi:hypothetical protein